MPECGRRGRGLVIVNSTSRIQGKFFAFASVILWLFLVSCDIRPKIEQPVSYSHAIHLTQAGMDCVECHVGVETQLRATLPSIARCKTCHSKAKSDNPEEAKVVEAVMSNSEIPWQRIYVLPDHVFFSHRRHVKSGKISCTVCHGDVKTLTEPPPRPIVPIAMPTCMGCHDNKSISNDCLTCHV